MACVPHRRPSCEQVITIGSMFTVKRTAEFDAWLAGLKDGLSRIRLAKRLDKVQRGLLGDVEPVGERVSEMRELFEYRCSHCIVQVH